MPEWDGNSDLLLSNTVISLQRTVSCLVGRDGSETHLRAYPDCGFPASLFSLLKRLSPVVDDVQNVAELAAIQTITMRDWFSLSRDNDSRL